MPKKPTGPKLKASSLGYYEIHWTDAGRSKRVSTGTKDVQEAQAFLAGWIHENKKADNSSSVHVVLESYKRERIRDRSPRTAGVIESKLIPFFGDLPVDALSADTIEEYVESRRSGDKPAKTGTIRREVGVLVAAINHAKKQRRVDPAIVPHINLPDGSPAKTSVFTDEQLDQLIQIVAPAAFQKCSRICRFFWIAMETASRRRAIETLSWSRQVDFRNRMIQFDNDGSGTLRKIKRRAKVPISDRLLPMLQRFYEERESDLVLGEEVDIYQSWRALMKRAVKLTGDKSFNGMTPHDLRRTWATRAAQCGISIWDIAGILGDTPASVTKSYAHHSPDFLRTAANFRNAS